MEDRQGKLIPFFHLKTAIAKPGTTHGITVKIHSNSHLKTVIAENEDGVS